MPNFTMPTYRVDQNSRKKHLQIAEEEENREVVFGSFGVICSTAGDGGCRVL